VTLETLRQQQGVEIAMAGEVDSEHLVGLAFVPPRSGIHLATACDRWRRGWDLRPQQERVDSANLRPSHMSDDGEACIQLINCGQEVEEGAPKLVVSSSHRVDPGDGIDVKRGWAKARVWHDGVRLRYLIEPAHLSASEA